MMNNQIDQKYAAGELWDKIDRQAEKDMDETLQATTRILGIADDAQKIGLNTLIELNQQGEKLQNIRKTVDEMETDVSYTKWLLRSGFGCCSCLWVPFKPKDKFDFIKTQNPPNHDFNTGQIINFQPTRSVAWSSISDQFNPSSHLVEHKINHNLRTISLILDDLNNISKDMSDELDIQNNLIADTIKQSSKTEQELQTVNRLSKNLI